MAVVKDLYADDIIRLLDDATDESKYGIMKIVSERASIKEMLAAMQSTDSFFSACLVD